MPCTTSVLRTGTSEKSATPRALRACLLASSPNGGQSVSGFGAWGEISFSTLHSSTRRFVVSFVLSGFLSMAPSVVAASTGAAVPGLPTAAPAAGAGLPVVARAMAAAAATFALHGGHAQVESSAFDGSNLIQSAWYHLSHASQLIMKLPSLGPPQRQCLAPLSSIVLCSRASSDIVKGMSLVSVRSFSRYALSYGAVSPGIGRKARFAFSCHNLARAMIDLIIRTHFSSGNLNAAVSYNSMHCLISSMLAFLARRVKARNDHDMPPSALITSLTSLRSDMPNFVASWIIATIGKEMLPLARGRLATASSSVAGMRTVSLTMIHQCLRKPFRESSRSSLALISTD
mmetsp:Transcript_9489/g.20353  ORF Transcript_9489/g.20353 Transcript_9489/m.20353 type:complete len:345 (-) Transcript_9489:38-1072(-)